MRFIFLLSISLLSASLLFAQKKADKKIIAALQQHVAYLSSNSNDTAACSYIKNQFKEEGLLPEGDSDYLQKFILDKGKMANSNTTFSINDQSLKLGEDFFPLPYSKNGKMKGEPIISINEQGKPWLINMKDAMEDLKNNDTASLLYDKAVQAQNNGASGVIFFNDNDNIPDIFFNAKSNQPVLKIPVVYVTHQAAGKYFADGSASVKLAASIDLKENMLSLYNVIGYLNHHQPYTIIIAADYNNEKQNKAGDAAALIEMSRLLANEKPDEYNYLFVAFSGKDTTLPGSKYFVDHAQELSKINCAINLNGIGKLNNDALYLHGFSSSSWRNIIDKTKEKDLTIHLDSAGQSAAYISFSEKNIPGLLIFSKANDENEKINYKGELEVIKYIDRLLKTTNHFPKMTL